MASDTYFEKAKEHRNCPVPSEVGGSEIYAEAPHPNHYLLLKGRTMHLLLRSSAGETLPSK